MQKIRWFFLILCIITTLVLVAQNNEAASLKFLVFEQTLPMSVMLLSAGGIGFLLGAFMTVSMLRHRRKAEKRKVETAAKREAEKAESSPNTSLSDPSATQTETATASPLG